MICKKGTHWLGGNNFKEMEMPIRLVPEGTPQITQKFKVLKPFKIEILIS